MTQSSTAFFSVKLPTASEPANQTDALPTQFTAEENDGSLVQRVREVVASNRSKAGPAAA